MIVPKCLYDLGKCDKLSKKHLTFDFRRLSYCWRKTLVTWNDRILKAMVFGSFATPASSRLIITRTLASINNLKWIKVWNTHNSLILKKSGLRKSKLNLQELRKKKKWKLNQKIINSDHL
jgi:hypothetical protein